MTFYARAFAVHTRWLTAWIGNGVGVCVFVYMFHFGCGTKSRNTYHSLSLSVCVPYYMRKKNALEKCTNNKQTFNSLQIAHIFREQTISRNFSQFLSIEYVLTQSFFNTRPFWIAILTKFWCASIAENNKNSATGMASQRQLSFVFI